MTVTNMYSVSLAVEDNKKSAKLNFGNKASSLGEVLSKGYDFIKIPRFVVIPTNVTFDIKSADDAPSIIADLVKRTVSNIRYSQYDHSFYNNILPTFSVRSGAPVSMPGMMETVHNVGLNVENLPLFAGSQNTTLENARECLIGQYKSFATAVYGVSYEQIEEIEESLRLFDIELYSEEGVEFYRSAIERISNQTYPTSLSDQLYAAIEAVFNSWYSERAVYYREMENIPDHYGTAVMIQEMVYGNLNENSLTAVAFSHNLDTGERGYFGEYLISAQGEEVVSGTTIARPINEITDCDDALSTELRHLIDTLEKMAESPVDIEVTVSNGQLYLLQWREAKMSTRALIRYHVDRQSDLSTETVVDNIYKIIESKIGVETSDLKPGKAFCGSGVSINSGVVVGHAAFNMAQAKEFVKQGLPYIYIRHATTPSDIDGMSQALGFLTASGGPSSHAALIARKLDKVCIVGCTDLTIGADMNEAQFLNGGKIKSGDVITINANEGKVFV